MKFYSNGGHAMADTLIQIAGWRREAGEALCSRRKLRIVTENAPLKRVTCPRCLLILDRLEVTK